jgi:acyl-CoA hydrolase
MNPAGGRPATHDDAGRLAEAIVERVGKRIVLALPLGLGKANRIANALYAKAVADRSLQLTIFTALTLEVPHARAELERRFVEPLAQRVFAGYPALDYASAIHAGTLPPNVEVNEFFLLAGQWLGSPYAQQHYIAANYTHALHAVLDRGVNVIGQLVARRAGESAHPYSLSCNPDLTLDLLDLRRAGRVNFVFAGEVNSALPFMDGEAAIAEAEFDLLLDGPVADFPLFGPPRAPIAPADHAAGLLAASLVPDGGTLQIGIGSLGDAVAHALVLRHRRPDDFRALLARLSPDAAADATVHATPFAAGLYGCSEMFVEGFLDLYRAGVLTREVDGGVLDAGFFVGSRAFYAALRAMPRAELAKFRMRRIGYVNELYGDEAEKRAARVGARFINDAMMATLLGDVVSDALEDGRVVSGVGGQFNFVAQALALDGARSIILLRAARTVRGRAQSNIRWRYGHVTIPRHLRDVVVTEYGVADLRGKPDREVIARMLAITDARFQDELLREAKDAGKIERSYVLPAAVRDNTPERIARAFAALPDLLPAFPFGTDFTATEQRLLAALALLKSAAPGDIARLFVRGLFSGPPDAECLARLRLAKPTGLAERFYATLVRGALAASGAAT